MRTFLWTTLAAIGWIACSTSSTQTNDTSPSPADTAPTADTAQPLGDSADTGSASVRPDTGTGAPTDESPADTASIETGSADTHPLDTVSTEAGPSDTASAPSSDDQTDSGTEPPFTFGTTTVHVVNKDKDYATTTLGPVSTTGIRNQYGGDCSVTVEATGYFRTVQYGGRWYFADPEGCLFLSVGVNSVTPGGDIPLPDALLALGFNTMGNWSDHASINAGATKIPYTPHFSFAANFAKDDTFDGGTTYLEDLYASGVLPVVFDDFDAFCDSFAQQIADLADDPWVLGIFSDNELPFYDGSGSYGDVLDRWLALPGDDAYRTYAVSWLQARGKTDTTADDADKADFAAHIVAVYYAKVSAAIRTYDPHHLYLGTRFHGGAKYQPHLFAAAAPYVDVFSVNYYGSWTPDADAMDAWLAAGDKPFLITEFYVKGEDSGLGNEDGAGWTVPTQTDRGLFYTHWLLHLYSHPGAIGSHWFRYMDKPGQDSNKGLLTETFQWYTPLRDAAYNVNRDIYRLVRFLQHNPLP